MKHKAALLAAALGGAVVLAGVLFLSMSVSKYTNASSVAGPDMPAPNRIVSLAPSVTEALFALSLGDRVVGVTRFCKYPPEALAKSKVGGYLDASLEGILLLHPDLVVVLPEHEEVKTRLERLGLRTLVVHQESVAEILDSIDVLGKVCGVGEKADELLTGLKRRMERVKSRIAQAGLGAEESSRPRVLVSVGREAGTLGKIYAAGPRTFYHELIEAAGGQNVCDTRVAAYPLISKEGLSWLDPDIIIEVYPGMVERGVTEESVVAEWSEAGNVKAVREGRVHVLSEEYVCVPGPRFVNILEQMARIIHPEIDWERE